MKTKNRQFFLIILSLLFIVSCSGDDSNNESTKPEIKNINDIILTTTLINTPTTPEDSGNYSVFFSMAGDKVYYANPSNTPLTQFMLEYNLNTNEFTSKMTNNEVCACGFSSVIVSDGTDLFYITNDAVRYSSGTNMWSNLSYPNEFRDNNGETGIVYYNGKIYFYGGRTPTNRFKYYDISADTWHDAPNGPYVATTSEMIALGNTIYSIGGTSYTNSSMEQINNRRRFVSYTEGGGWTTMPDLPFEFSAFWRSHLTAALNNRFIFALSSDKIYIYDTDSQIWKDEPITLEVDAININNRNLFSYNVKLYLAGKSSTNEFKIYEIEAQLPSD